MPHIGRPYPYHPEYWATEAWFYRGFVPWKLTAEPEFPIPPFFGCVVGAFIPPSGPGETTGDAKKIKYTFVADGECLVTQMEVTLEAISPGVGGSARWNLKSYYWDGSFETQFLDQPYPQRVVLSPWFTMTVPNPDVGPSLLMLVRFHPATYDEGGSPFG